MKGRKTIESIANGQYQDILKKESGRSAGECNFDYIKFAMLNQETVTISEFIFSGFSRLNAFIRKTWKELDYLSLYHIQRRLVWYYIPGPNEVR